MALRSSKKTIDLAANVHSVQRASVADSRSLLAAPMNRDFQIRFTAVLLVLLTVAAITLASISFRKGSQYPAPYDGVNWIERRQGPVPDHGAGISPRPRRARHTATS